MIETHFNPISLAELNAKAEMLTRLDNKYVIPMAVLEQLAPELDAHFDILDINGQRSFGYRTQYFDTPDLTSFRHHMQGRRQRSKVRTRQYLDAEDLCFLEVKLKTRRKVTVKKRLSYAPKRLSELTNQAFDFVAKAHVDQYGKPLLPDYAPVMLMQYQRMTLVARDGGERLTIDRALDFQGAAGQNRSISPDMLIVETKSAFGRGIADGILRRSGHHPVGSCSKYCVGLAALGLVPRFNKFLPAYRRLFQGQGPAQHMAGRHAARPAAAGARGALAMAQAR